MPLDLVWLSNMGLPEIMLWLLTFAVVYGALEKIKFIANKEINAIIAMVTGFMVLLAAPLELILVLSSMSQSLVLVVLGIMVLLVFIEVAGLKHYEYIPGKDGLQKVEVELFTANSYVLGIALIIIVGLIFVGAGGLELLGLQVDLTGSLSTSMIFFVVVIIAILWMITAGSEGPKSKLNILKN